MSTPPVSLPLDQLADPVRLHSRALGEDLWIVPDGYTGPEPKGVTYSVSECRLLVELRPGPSELAAIHRAKAHLDAALVRDEDRSGARQAYRAAMARYHDLERQWTQRGSPEAEAELRALADTLNRLTLELNGP